MKKQITRVSTAHDELVSQVVGFDVRETVYGWGIGYFVIHRASHPRHPEMKWSITHRPTGRQVAPARTKKIAFKYARLFRALPFDWASESPDFIHKVPKRHLNAARRLKKCAHEEAS